MRPFLTLSILIGCLSIDFAAAADPPPQTSSRILGEDTRRWLELQRSGASASETPQRLPAPAATAAYKRYVDSFKHEIPEFFKIERGTHGGRSN
ncbi:DUF3613 domain-containing protein [Methylohalobius crimeensis]|uniref:DUF3613 domain-containing protein n=1 Tax=Methylohalobius crimeensis TaxID=244365 RepID=UPI0003B381ED|nr:DUF3613 domain-containing protein [Methylohalobius crimeensis]